MSRLELDIELLTDVSCSEQARTLGGGATHDYIPGRMLWGVLATRLYQQAPQQAEALMFSGDIRVSDARLAISGTRSAPVPRSWHRPKGYQGLDTVVDLARAARPTGTALTEVRGSVTELGEAAEGARRALSLRTAMTEDGRARDAHLFSIEAIPAGSTLKAFVEFKTPEQQSLVERYMTGEAHVGRSRNAEFGLVRVTVGRSAPSSAPVTGTEDVRVMCVSRLVLRDSQTSAPRLVPNAADFGLPEQYRLVEDKTFIRTSRHSPFNGRHLRPMTERQCIEAGSVIVFASEGRGADSDADILAAHRHCTAGVGLYVSQGFGEVWVNPSILVSARPISAQPPAPARRPPPTDPLFQWAAARAGVKTASRAGHAWAESQPTSPFRKSTTAQWGAIRTLAQAAALTGSFSRLKQAISAHVDQGASRALWGDAAAERSHAGVLMAALDDLASKPWPDTTKVQAVELLANCMTRSLKQNGGDCHE